MGADEGDGKMVVYCVTITTGGTCSDVEGRSSAEGAADAVAVGKTVVYSVFMTTGSDEVVMVVLTAGRAPDPEESSDDTAELDMELGTTELMTAELEATELAATELTTTVLGAKKAAVELSSGEYVNMGGA